MDGVSFLENMKKPALLLQVYLVTHYKNFSKRSITLMLKLNNHKNLKMKSLNQKEMITITAKGCIPMYDDSPVLLCTLWEYLF